MVIKVTLLPIRPVNASPSSFWRSQLRQWHWISSALCLVGILLFSVTGITLNHAADIKADPKTTTVEKTLPPEVLADLKIAEDKKPLPTRLAKALSDLTGTPISKIVPEISDEEIYLDLPGPGVDRNLTIERETGHVTYERTDRGVVAVVNDLHKGRHTGAVWAAFIDILAVACIIFAVTGFGLLWLYARGRAITWPLIAFGTLVPFLLFLLFVHM